MRVFDALRPDGFRKSQYRYLRMDEWPKKGPFVDITSALDANKKHIDFLSNRIAHKRRETDTWLSQSGASDKAAIYLTRPTAFAENTAVQFRLAQFMDYLIQKVYRGQYPLESSAEAFFEEIQRGTLFPYLGLVGPSQFGNGAVYSNPDILFERSIRPVQTAAIILGEKGYGELGRNAKDSDIEGFQGGAITLERTLDFERGRFRLPERIHTLTTDMRGSDSHGGIPSSGAVQTINLSDAAFRIRIAAPMYVVGGALEKFFSALKPRDWNNFRKTNRGKTIYTAPGDHIPFIQALWQHQLGFKPKMEVVHIDSDTYSLGKFDYYSERIYSPVNVLDEHNERYDPRRTHTLINVLDEAEKMAPVVLVKMEAETPRSAATQKKLLDRGYVICGLEGAHDEEYLEKNNGNGFIKKRHKAPIFIYLARLGESTRREIVSMAQPYYVPDVSIYGRELRQQLSAVDYRFQQQVGVY